MSDSVNINSASEVTESAEFGSPEAGNRIPLGIDGGDASINTVADETSAPSIGSAVTTISVAEEGEVPLASAAD